MGVLVLDDGVVEVGVVVYEVEDAAGVEADVVAVRVRGDEHVSSYLRFYFEERAQFYSPSNEHLLVLHKCLLQREREQPDTAIGGHHNKPFGLELPTIVKPAYGHNPLIGYLLGHNERIIAAQRPPVPHIEHPAIRRRHKLTAIPGERQRRDISRRLLDAHPTKVRQ